MLVVLDIYFYIYIFFYIYTTLQLVMNGQV